MGEEEPSPANITVEDLRSTDFSSAEVEELVDRYQDDFNYTAQTKGIVTEDSVTATLGMDDTEERGGDGLYQRLTSYIGGDSSFSQQEQDAVARQLDKWATARTDVEDSDGIATKIARKTFDDFDTDFYKIDEGGFKSVYVEDSDRDHRKIMYVPNEEATFRERMEQVMTWQRNAEKLQDHGIPTAGDGYRVTVTAIDGERMPVMLGELAHDLEPVQPRQHDDIDGDDAAEYKKRQQQAYEVRQELFEMARNGDYVTGEDKHGFKRGKTNIAYDEEREEVVVVDLGELSKTYFTGQTDISGPYDSREDYLQQTGLDDRIQAFTATIDTEDEYQQ